MLVRVGEAIGHLARDRDRFVERKLPALRNRLAEALRFHERHHVVREAAHGARVDQRQQMRMLKPGDDVDLTQETLDADRVRKRLVQHLDRDAPAMLHIIRQEDGRHATFGDS